MKELQSVTVPCEDVVNFLRASHEQIAGDGSGVCLRLNPSCACEIYLAEALEVVELGAKAHATVHRSRRCADNS